MVNKGENPTRHSWTTYEHVLFQTIIDYIIEKSQDVDEEIVSKIYNRIVQHAESFPNALVPISFKTVLQIKTNIKKVKEQAALFREMYLRQIRFNSQ
jgi:hypothetical protein